MYVQGLFKPVQTRPVLHECLCVTEFINQSGEFKDIKYATY